MATMDIDEAKQHMRHNPFGESKHCFWGHPIANCDDSFTVGENGEYYSCLIHQNSPEWKLIRFFALKCVSKIAHLVNVNQIELIDEAIKIINQPEINDIVSKYGKNDFLIHKDDLTTKIGYFFIGLMLGKNISVFGKQLGLKMDSNKFYFVDGNIDQFILRIKDNCDNWWYLTNDAQLCDSFGVVKSKMDASLVKDFNKTQLILRGYKLWEIRERLESFQKGSFKNHLESNGEFSGVSLAQALLEINTFKKWYKESSDDKMSVLSDL